MKKKYIKYLNKDYKFDKLTMIGIICLIVVIAGLFGWLYEFIFYFINSGFKTFYYRGGNFLPWINVYVYGSMLIWIFCYKKRKKTLQVFLISALVCGILELFSGWFIYDVVKAFPRCWSYNEEILNFGNIGGYVCLRSVIFFGLSGLFLIYVIIPGCFYLARHINKKVFITISITLCSIFLIDELYNLIIANLFSLPRASTIYKKIGLKYMYFYK